ncbi:hypothetical protein Tco_0940820 [Tanacetum coccineum]|uniref:Retrovirus-related Pol polyprotein from transposon TNT 1-94-like beta-barrel domain-containing protein n=1 Tax=Tanacetum coccineum TaxID=301880 RepID=A0ABQ5DP34_9ASTR
MQYFEQTHVDDFQDNEIHSGSNIILYSQYLQESQDVVIQDTNTSAPNDLLVLSLVEQITDHVAHLDKENQTNKMVNESLTAELERYKERIAIFEQRLNEIDTLKETLSNNVKEKESLSKTLTVFKTESKEKESKYIDKEIVLEKQNKELENIICKMYRSTQAMHMLTKPQVFYDDTHKQALGYQNPFHLKKAQRIQPTLYDGSVIAKEHAVISVIDDEETLILEEESRSKMLDKQNDPISIEKKIKISPIDYSKLNKIKEDFGKCFVTKKELSAEQAFWLKHSSLSETPSVKSHTHVRIESPSKLSKGFEHTKACFITEIIPFLKVLKDTFNVFDKTLLDEITEVQTVFNQMEDVVDQCSVDKNAFEIQIKQLSIDNDQLLNQIIKCLELETELIKKKDFIEKEIFQRDNSGENLNAPTLNQLFEINKLKAQSQEKDTVIRKLKDRIKSLSGKENVKKDKKDIDEIETINIELEHSVSVENSDLNAQLHEKVFAIIALKNELRKLKGKNVVDTTVSKPNATIALRMFKLDIEPISHRLKNNRDAHEVYLDTLRGFVECARKQNLSEPILESACMFTKHVQEFLVYVIRVNSTTSASGSKPSDNTKKNKITQPPSSNQKNKVEAHPRKVKSSLNKTNSISEPINFTHVTHSVIQIVLWYLDSGCSKHMTGNHSQLINFVSKFLGTVRFENDHIGKIMGYGDYQMGNVTISRGYYVEGLGLIRGLPKLKYQKDHLFSACAFSKSKKHSHKPKDEDFIQEKLYLLHMDLCGPMRI